MVISVLEKTLEKASKFIGKISHNSFATFSSSNKSEKSDSNENENENQQKDLEAPRKKLKNNLKKSIEISSVTSTESSSPPVSILEESSKREISSSIFHLAKSLSAVSLLMDSAKNSYAIAYSPSIQTVLKRKESTSTLSVFTALQALGKRGDRLLLLSVQFHQTFCFLVLYLTFSLSFSRSMLHSLRSLDASFSLTPTFSHFVSFSLSLSLPFPLPPSPSLSLSLSLSDYLS